LEFLGFVRSAAQISLGLIFKVRTEDKMNSAEVKGLDDDNTEEFLDLICSDGSRVKISKNLIHMSAYIKGIVDADSTVKEIHLKEISSTAIGYMLEWMNYHKNIEPRPIPKPLKSANLKEVVLAWDANFIDKDLESVFELLLTSNFLGVNDLLNLCCARVGSMMLGKTPRQIRKGFNIPDEFTPEDEAMIRKEFAEFL
jgi:hypothetical protein